MTRREALAAQVVAFLLIAGGLAWILGGYGLIIAGIALAAVSLFGVKLTEERRGEPVPNAVPEAVRGFPYHL